GVEREGLFLVVQRDAKRPIRRKAVTARAGRAQVEGLRHPPPEGSRLWSAPASADSPASDLILMPVLVVRKLAKQNRELGVAGSVHLGRQLFVAARGLTLHGRRDIHQLINRSYLCDRKYGVDRFFHVSSSLREKRRGAIEELPIDTSFRRCAAASRNSL